MRSADPVTGKLRALADEWHSHVGLSDPQVADRVRGDRIDILVDLALHTANNRLLVFARKPAPVQVTMLGLPTTTGLATMDYRLTDPYLDPPGTSDADYTERSIRLPHCFWCYQPPEESPPVGELPARKNGFVTFGCLNQFAKVSRPALELMADAPAIACPRRDWSFNRCRAVTAIECTGCSRTAASPAIASNSSPGSLDSRISSAITTWICVSIPFPTTGPPPRWIPSGWAFRWSLWPAARGWDGRE